MTAVWPPELPPPLRAGLELGYGDGRLKPTAEGGPPRSRERFASTPRLFQCTQDYDDNEAARLERFYEEELFQGVLPFLLENWLTRGVALGTIQGEILTTTDGEAITIVDTWRCNFADGLPRRQPHGIRFRVAFQLWVHRT